MTNGARSVGQLVAGGTLWATGMRWFARGLGVVSSLVLARLLVPADFGLVAKAALVYEILSLITALGLESALITRQLAGASHYNTAWTIHVLRGLVIGATIVVLAAPIAQFFNEPQLAAILPFYGLAAVIEGCINIGTVDFRKNFRFELEFQFEFYKRISGFVVALGVALIWRTYWAFVAGVIAGSLASLSASYLLSRYRPRIELTQWRDLLHFGKWMLPAEIVTAFATRVDGLILSRTSAAHTVGVYTVANEIAAAPSTELAMPVGRALMPGLARLNVAPAEFRALNLATTALVMCFALPAAFGIAAVAAPLIRLLLGDAWMEAVPLLIALSLAGVGRAIAALSSAAFLAYDRADLYMLTAIVSLIVRAVLLPIGYMIADVGGLAWAMTVSGVLIAIAITALQHRVGMLDAVVLFKTNARILLAALVMYVLVVQLVEILPQESALARAGFLAVAIAAGAASFVAVLLFLWWAARRPRGPETAVLDYLRRLRTVTPAP